MTAPIDRTDIAAFAIYRTFIAGGFGTCQWKRDAEGKIVKDHRGDPVAETPDEAAMRRWFAAPEKTREQFRREAIAAISAWGEAA